MRLLTHNYLQSNVKGTEKGYPLVIEPTKIELEESPCDLDFIRALLSKIDYDAVLSARGQILERCRADLGSEFVLPELPESISTCSEASDGDGSNGDGDEKDHTNTSSLSSEIDEGLMKKLHLILLDIHIVEGHLICPDTGRRFNITKGIPNMILHEDEI